MFQMHGLVNYWGPGGGVTPPEILDQAKPFLDDLIKILELNFDIVQGPETTTDDRGEPYTTYGPNGPVPEGEYNMFAPDPQIVCDMLASYMVAMRDMQPLSDPQLCVRTQPALIHDPVKGWAVRIRCTIREKNQPIAA